MKFDPDLVPTLLAHVDRQPHGNELVDLSIEGSDVATVSEHVRLLDSFGYVTAAAIWTFPGEIWKSMQITWKGTGFLTRASNDAVWHRARKRLEKQVISQPDLKLEVPTQ